MGAGLQVETEWQKAPTFHAFEAFKHDGGGRLPFLCLTGMEIILDSLSMSDELPSIWTGWHRGESVQAKVLKIRTMSRRPDCLRWGPRTPENPNNWDS
jgi:hypothetical protein